MVTELEYVCLFTLQYSDVFAYSKLIKFLSQILYYLTAELKKPE
jgi:hypothetical protein